MALCGTRSVASCVEREENKLTFQCMCVVAGFCYSSILLMPIIQHVAETQPLKEEGTALKRCSITPYYGLDLTGL